MSLLKAILQAQGGSAVGQLAQQFGLDSRQADSALANLVPALAGGVKRNINHGGLDSLVSALTQGNHSQYIDNRQRLSSPETITDGNAILGHLFGSKDISRQVASRASGQTGIDASILKKMLPIVATLVMGSMAKQSSSGSALAATAGSGQAQGSGIENILTSFLDEDGDGSMVDDLLEKLFK